MIRVIRKIHLKNWKTHKDTTMDFSRGINVIIGVMGAGKSSVMDAISFALFGDFPAHNHGRISLAELIMSRPESQDSAEVMLEFESGGATYAVTRTIESNGSSTARIDKDGQYLQTQAKRVNEEVERALGIDYDVFTRAVYSEQNRLDYFLELRKGERKKQIDQMLGLDHFATAEENATSLSNSIKQIITDEENMIGSLDVGKLETELGELTAKRDELAASLVKLGGDIKEAESVAADAKAKVSKLREDYSKKVAASKEVAQIASRIATLEDEAKKIRGLNIDAELVMTEKTKKEADEKEESAKVERIRKDAISIAKETAGLEANIKNLRKKVAERDEIKSKIGSRTIEDASARLKSCSAKTESLVTALSEAKARAKEMQKALEQLESHLGKCPVCERDIGEELRANLINSRREGIAKLGNEAAAFEAELSATKKDMKKLEDEKAELSIALANLNGYKGIDEELSALEARLPDLKAKSLNGIELEKKASKLLETIRKELNELKLKEDSARRLKEYDAAIVSSNSKLAELQKKLSAIEVDEKLLYSSQEELSKAEAVLSRITSEMNSKKELTGMLASQIEGKTKEIDSFQSMKKRIERRRAVLFNIGKFKSALIETEGSLRNRLVTSINGVMSSLWPKLYPYSDYQGIRLSAKKDDYSLEVDTGIDGDGRWAGVDAIASGGERSTACLAMRMGLAMVIVPNLKWLILDEPTHNLDSNGILSLVSVLGTTLPQVVDQVFIITHEEGLKQISMAKVFMLMRDKATNSPTSISEL